MSSYEYRTNYWVLVMSVCDRVIISTGKAIMLADKIRRSTIENNVRSAAILYAHANAQYGEPLPKIRFVSDIPFILQVNFVHRRRFGWKNHSLLDAFGIEMAADLDELHEMMKEDEPWDVVMVSFPHQQATASLGEAIISYHRSREEEPVEPEANQPRHRAN